MESLLLIYLLAVEHVAYGNRQTHAYEYDTVSKVVEYMSKQKQAELDTHRIETPHCHFVGILNILGHNSSHWE